MLEIIFDSTFVDSLIILKYQNNPIHFPSNISHFPSPYDQYIPALISVDKKCIFFLAYNYQKNNSILYHSNEEWNDLQNLTWINDIYNIIINCSFLGNSYLGVVVNNKPSLLLFYAPNKEMNNNIICYNDNTEIYLEWNCYSYVDKLNNCALVKSNTNLINDPFNNSYDCYRVPNKDIIFVTNEGLLSFNSTSTNNFIIYLLKSCKSFDNYYNVIKNSFIKEPLIDICYKIKNLIYLPPKIEYSKIFNLFKIHDNKYFNDKITVFNKNVIGMLYNFETIYDNQSEYLYPTHIGSLMYSVKKDLMIEICLLHRRLNIFLNEKKAFYDKFPNSPYIILFDKFNDTLKNNIHINSKELCELYESDDDNLRIDEISQLLLETVKYRSNVFVFMYKQYLKTKNKNRNNNKINNYFPFKVFSSNLFILDHILSVANY